MTTPSFLPGLILVCAAIAGCSSSVARGDGCQTDVGSTAQLESAIACAEAGAVIRLAPGDYVAAKLTGRQAAVEIRSADPERPAVFTEMTIARSDGVTLDGIHFRGRPSGQRHQLMVNRSRGIALRNLRFSGGTPGDPAMTAAAVMLRDSEDVEVADSRFDAYWHAISMLNLDRVRIARNRFVNLRTDGIRGGGVSNAVIEANVLSDFFPAAGDHPDGIQLWSTHQTIAARNIVIRANLVMRGKGGPTQGIFIRDTHKQLPFENVKIVDNLVVGGLYNGITIDGAIDAEVRGNTVLPAADRQSWIRLERAVSATVADNRAGRFVLRGDIAQSGNRVVAPRADATAEIARWSKRTGIRP